MLTGCPALQILVRRVVWIGRGSEFSFDVSQTDSQERAGVVKTGRQFSLKKYDTAASLFVL